MELVCGADDPAPVHRTLGLEDRVFILRDVLRDAVEGDVEGVAECSLKLWISSLPSWFTRDSRTAWAARTASAANPSSSAARPAMSSASRRSRPGLAIGSDLTLTSNRRWEGHFPPKPVHPVASTHRAGRRCPPDARARPWLGPSLRSSGPSQARSVVPRLGIAVLAELGEAHVAHPKDHGADASALRTVGHDQ
jgi:hypothetical protein